LLDDKERRCFLGLAHKAIRADERVSEAEEEIFESYKAECGMTDFVPENDSVDDIVAQLKELPIEKLRIIIIELYGILLADDSLADSEARFVQEIAHQLNIRDVELRRMKRWSLDFINVVEDGYRLIQSR
jgi:uncharacterized tellurite resistance protein B-like protein